MQARIGAVLRKQLAEIAKIAVDVDVVLIPSPQMREAVRVDGVAEHDGDTTRSQRPVSAVVVQQRNLAPGSAEAFDTMHAGRQQQHRRRVGVAEYRDVHGQRLALNAPRRGMHVTFERQ